MQMLMLLLSAISLLAWLYLLFLHHGFWRADQRLGKAKPLADWPDVCAIIPARNEVQTIARSIRSLLDQDYPGLFRVVLVDDESDDGTADAARLEAEKSGDADRLQIITTPPLEKGWTGKLWALSHGVNAVGECAEFLWFNDADIVHRPDVLRRLVSKARHDNRDLVSLMVKLRTVSFWEKRLVPAFIFFFQMLYPFPAINNPQSRVAGAAGGCILVKCVTFERAGGIGVMRDALIDDCTMAAHIQKAGGRLWLGLAEDSRSLRQADGLRPLWVMVKRTAFTQLKYSAALLVGAVLAMAVVFVTPPIVMIMAPFVGWCGAGFLAALSFVLMTFAYWPTQRYYGNRFWNVFTLPVIALLYMAMTIHSAIDHWRGKGSEWKGRDYGKSGDVSDRDAASA